MIMKSDHPWANFLYVRRILIEFLANENKTDEEIAKILSMDTMQVTLIRMTPVEK